MKTIFRLFLVLAMVVIANTSFGQTLTKEAFIEQLIKENPQLGNVDKETLWAELVKQNPDLESMLAKGDIIGINLIPFSDPAYEWTQYDTKSAKVIIKEIGMILTSKEDSQHVMSIAEFPIDPQESSFELGLSFFKTKAEDGKYVGIVFDYENNKNYKGFIVSKKDFIFFQVEKGEMSIIKQGLVKPGKTINTLTMKRENQKIEITLNGLEVTTLKRVNITQPYLGVMIQGKMSVICNGFNFSIINTDSETEQSTSDV